MSTDKAASMFVFGRKVGFTTRLKDGAFSIIKAGSAEKKHEALRSDKQTINTTKKRVVYVSHCILA